MNCSTKLWRINNKHTQTNKKNLRYYLKSFIYKMISAQFPLWEHEINNKAILKIDETI